MRARLPAALGFLLLATPIAGGCGSAPPPLMTGAGAEDAGSSITTGSLLPDAALPPPSCDAGFQGGVCGCLDLTLLGDPPNMYFLLDRSGSMNDDGKWTTIRTVIADVIQRLGPRARFGAAVFPDPNADDTCAPGVTVMNPMAGSAPAGVPGATQETFTSATSFPAGGGTPTAATFTALGPSIAAFSGKTFVILATDGGPNCDAHVTCDVSACIPNIEAVPGCDPVSGPDCCSGYSLDCLDSAATVQAISALAARGIPTYVVGVPGSEPYAALLDQMATAGGTARAAAPYYYAVSRSDQAAFTSALASVAASITATCTLNLSEAPPDPTHVNVYLDGVVVPQDPVNGWSLSGTTVTLLGTTCQSVLAGDSLDLRVVAGCPTILK